MNKLSFDTVSRLTDQVWDDKRAVKSGAIFKSRRIEANHMQKPITKPSLC
ncbi:hypothetical protein FORC36_3993 [Vibrio vulnificus]|nr:hypothetical protein FORC36_3993 [Vibrio vulnificus]